MIFEMLHSYICVIMFENQPVVDVPLNVVDRYINVDQFEEVLRFVDRNSLILIDLLMICNRC